VRREREPRRARVLEVVPDSLAEVLLVHAWASAARNFTLSGA
jgi:hypothetical protein